MRILVLYNATQTYTQTVFEHLDAFRRYSRHEVRYCHHDQRQGPHVDLSSFDAIVVHYSIRLPFDQLGEIGALALESYAGAKVLFIQDEYDNTDRAKYWIKRIGFQLIFTVVPANSVQKVYPEAEFPEARFVSNLTGYVPYDISADFGTIRPPSSRSLTIGYRGRPLPIRYGALGREKVEIGCRVKAYCEKLGVSNDIAWSEEARIYGPRWYEFLASCRGMLGSESGANVFDWDGALGRRIDDFRGTNRGAPDALVYQAIVEPLEQPGLMNQVSPRVFEMISARTAMVLLEGSYSGVVSPNEHYIPLKKDYSNLDEVFARLRDGDYIDKLTERAYRDVVESGKYSYARFVAGVDAELDAVVARIGSRGQAPQLATSIDAIAHTPAPQKAEPPEPVTRAPIRAAPPLLFGARSALGRATAGAIIFIWTRVPLQLRPHIKRLFGWA